MQSVARLRETRADATVVCAQVYGSLSGEVLLDPRPETFCNQKEGLTFRLPKKETTREVV